MRRITSAAMVFAAAGTAALAIAVPSGSAQTPGATTLTFYEPEDAGTFAIIDNAPKSPSKNPQSKKYRFSAGDKLVFSSPLYDKKGGTRLGTLYVDSTIVKGTTFANISALAAGTYVLNDGSQIAVSGVFALAKATSTLSVVGGTGKYEGARGHLVTTDTLDTLTLLP